MDRNDDACFVCKGQGELVCCDVCPRAYHQQCCDITLKELNSDDEWACPHCRTNHDAQQQQQHAAKRPKTGACSSSSSSSSSLPSAPPSSSSAAKTTRSTASTTASAQAASTTLSASGAGAGAGAGAGETQGTEPAPGLTLHEGRCTFCNQAGQVLDCSGCSKPFHPYCALLELEDVKTRTLWYCEECSRSGVSISATVDRAATARQRREVELQEILRKVDVDRIKSGRSLTNSAVRKPSKTAGTGNSGGRQKVNGPTSALTSFLREKGITAANTGSRWDPYQRRHGRRRRRGRNEYEDTDDDDDDDDEGDDDDGGDDDDDDEVAVSGRMSTRGKHQLAEAKKKKKKKKEQQKLNAKRKAEEAAARKERQKHAVLEAAR